MTESRVVVVLGGDPTERAAVTAAVLGRARGSALVLTGYPHAVDPGLDTSENGPVEVRADDPAARLEAYLSGAVDPDDDVLAALAAGGDTPLAAVLGWEYARRAAVAGYWETVVVELDGDLAAVRRIAAAGDLAEFVESRWPAHVRFASMAAGDLADLRVREAHRLALLAQGVADFLAGPVEVVPAGSGAARTAAMVALARGVVEPQIAPDGEGGTGSTIRSPCDLLRRLAWRGSGSGWSWTDSGYRYLCRHCCVDVFSWDRILIRGAGASRYDFCPTRSCGPRTSYPPMLWAGRGSIPLSSSTLDGRQTHREDR